MPNIFAIPNSPIRERTIQSEASAGFGYGLPTFKGYGRTGALRRIGDAKWSSAEWFIPGVRDRAKMHPARFGNRPGVNIRSGGRNRMDISAKFKEIEYIGNYVISGTTRDSQGAVLAGVTVDLFQTANDIWKGQAVSDVNGLFSIPVFTDLSNAYYLVAYKAGGTDVAGTTVNTIQAVRP